MPHHLAALCAVLGVSIGALLLGTAHPRTANQQAVSEPWDATNDCPELLSIFQVVKASVQDVFDGVTKFHNVVCGGVIDDRDSRRKIPVMPIGSCSGGEFGSGERAETFGLVFDRHCKDFRVFDEMTVQSRC